MPARAYEFVGQLCAGAGAVASGLGKVRYLN